MRTCGDCTFCCKALGVDAATFYKPPNQWCPHCEIGKGCKIYDERPGVCQEFVCEWIRNEDIPEAWRPDKIKACLVATPDVPGCDPSVTIWVDRFLPAKKSEAAALIQIVSKQIPTIVAQGHQKKLFTPNGKGGIIQEMDQIR
jgi:hypothetical protein